MQNIKTSAPLCCYIIIRCMLHPPHIATGGRIMDGYWVTMLLHLTLIISIIQRRTDGQVVCGWPDRAFPLETTVIFILLPVTALRALTIPISAVAEARAS